MAGSAYRRPHVLHEHKLIADHRMPWYTRRHPSHVAYNADKVAESLPGAQYAKGHMGLLRGQAANWFCAPSKVSVELQNIYSAHIPSPYGRLHAALPGCLSFQGALVPMPGRPLPSCGCPDGGPPTPTTIETRISTVDDELRTIQTMSLRRLLCLDLNDHQMMVV